MKSAFFIIKTFSLFKAFASLLSCSSGYSKHHENIAKRPPEERRWTGTIALNKRIQEDNFPIAKLQAMIDK